MKSSPRSTRVAAIRGFDDRYTAASNDSGGSSSERVEHGVAQGAGDSRAAIARGLGPRYRRDYRRPGIFEGVAEYKAGALAAEELVKALPEIKQFADVKVEQLFNVASDDLTLDNMLTLSKRINTIFATDSRVAESW